MTATTASMAPAFPANIRFSPANIAPNINKYQQISTGQMHRRDRQRHAKPNHPFTAQTTAAHVEARDALLGASSPDNWNDADATRQPASQPARLVVADDGICWDSHPNSQPHDATQSANSTLHSLQDRTRPLSLKQMFA